MMSDSESSNINSQSSVISSIPHPSTIPFTSGGPSSTPSPSPLSSSTPSTPQRSRTDSLDYALRKIFIGGLSYSTDEDKLRRYFKTYGAVQDAVVMKDPVSKRSRGFGFITYFDVASVENALANEPHTIDLRRVEAKRAVPRSEINRDNFNSSSGTPAPSYPNYYSNMSSNSTEESNFNAMSIPVTSTSVPPGPINRAHSSPLVKSWKGVIQPPSQNDNYSLNSSNSPAFEKLSSSQLANSPNANISSNLDSSKNGYGMNTSNFPSSDEYAYNKIFVGGLHYDTRDPDFRQYFEKYGKVISAEVMFNRETHKSRGFGFIIFESEETAIRVCNEKMHYIADKQVEVKRAIPRSKINPSSAYSSSLISSSTPPTPVSSDASTSPSVSSATPSSPSSPHTGAVNHNHSPNSSSRTDVRRSMSVSSIGMGSLSGNTSTLAASSSVKLPPTQNQSVGPSRKIASFHPTSTSELSSTPEIDSSSTKPTSYVAILKANASGSPVTSPSLSGLTPTPISSMDEYSFSLSSSFTLTGSNGAPSKDSHTIPAPPTPLVMTSLPQSSAPSLPNFLSDSLGSDSLLHNESWYPSMYDSGFFFPSQTPPQHCEDDLSNSRPSRAQSEPAISITKGWNELSFLTNNNYENFPSSHMHPSSSSSSLNTITENQSDPLGWLRATGGAGSENVFPSNASLSGSSIHSSPLSVSGADLSHNHPLNSLSLPPSIVPSGSNPAVPSFESWNNMVAANTSSIETPIEPHFDPSVSRIFQEINLNSSLSSIDESASKFLSMTRGSRANSELSSNSDLGRGDSTNSSNSLKNLNFSGFNGLVGNSQVPNGTTTGIGSGSGVSSSIGLGSISGSGSSSLNELRFDSKEWIPSGDYRFNP